MTVKKWSSRDMQPQPPNLPMYITTSIALLPESATRWAFSVKIDDGETVKEVVHGDCSSKEDALDLCAASFHAMATNRRIRRH